MIGTMIFQSIGYHNQWDGKNKKGNDVPDGVYFYSIEIGHGFDMSDYLNATRKTSYLKGGIFWDHNSPWFSTKLEFEHFQQISEIVESNLSRNQYIFEVIIPYKEKLYFNINLEVEDFIIPTQIDASSLTIALGWKGDFRKVF